MPDSEYPERVIDIVKRNKEKYEKHREEIENTIEEYEQNRGIINEWCNLAPESELEWLEYIKKLEAGQHDDNIQENVPHFNMRSES